MTTLIAYMAVALATAGLILIVQPSAILQYIQTQSGSTGFKWFAVAIRAVIGVAFILVAGASRFPTLITVIGGLALAAALFLAVIPKESFAALISRMAGMNFLLARIGGVATILAGWFIAYAVL
ncbi:MAG: hypothetical protein QGF90_18925 [Gammaproteobacteria bacterium]|nr:hypothetical protein [Gammaproteobacteria bacterium]